MDVKLLQTIFGRDQGWHGPCVVVADATLAVATTGFDSVQGGGSKVFAPRTVSGRLSVDAVSLLKDGSAMVLVQIHRSRQATGEENIRQAVTVLDPAHVVAIELPDVAALAEFGVPVPAPRATGSHPGVQQRPQAQ